MKYGELFFFCFFIKSLGKIFLAFKPQAGKAGIIGGKKDCAKGRVVMVYIMHVCSLLVLVL